MLRYVKCSCFVRIAIPSSPARTVPRPFRIGVFLVSTTLVINSVPLHIFHHAFHYFRKVLDDGFSCTGENVADLDPNVQVVRVPFLMDTLHIVVVKKTHWTLRTPWVYHALHLYSNSTTTDYLMSANTKYRRAPSPHKRKAKSRPRLLLCSTTDQ